ncbi:MAG: FprA family A-type flavoprotein [Bacteroidales bacterium]|nr:FprA family A-type flavoprotein [Bacteroidales bacterium]
MKNIELATGIFYVGVDDHRTDLFENHMQLPHGVSYNSYLLVDEKVVLIDPVEIGFVGQYLSNIRYILKARPVDILVVNHAEPDHSGSVAILQEEPPDMQIVGNAKTFAPLEAFYGPLANKHVVADGDVLSIGVHQLQFFTAPMVHWPESMVTFEQTTGILFSNDAFGGFGTLNGAAFDDQHDIAFYEDDMRRYFANIVGKVAVPTVKALQKLSGLSINMIAPSHGLIWRSQPEWVIGKYSQWAQHQSEEGVVIVFGSMYGNTARMADVIARGVADAGIREIRMYDVARTETSFILSDIWKYRGVVLGACAHYGDMFPNMSSLIHGLSSFKPQNKVFGLFGGMSWSGGGLSTLKKYAEELKWNVVAENVEVKGAPARDEDIEQLYQLGLAIGREVKTR